MKRKPVMSAEELRQVVSPIAERYGVRSITLFGSVARGDYGKGSDYDMLVDPGNVRSLLTLWAMLADVKAAVGRDVDFVYKGGLAPGSELSESIRRDGVLIYG